MTDILLRNVDDKLDKALRIRAIEHGWTREAEIKTILESAVLKKPRKRAFSEVLLAIPKIDGDVDELFRRSGSGSRQVNLD
jgi:plasmid stability protein